MCGDRQQTGPPVAPMLEEGWKGKGKGKTTIEQFT